MADPIEIRRTEQMETPLSELRISPGRLLLQHRWLVILGAVIGCVVAALYIARATPIYQSSTQVLVVKKSPDALPSSSGSGTGSASGSNSENDHHDYLSTHQTLIRSPLIVSNAVSQAELASLPTFAGRGDPTGEIISALKLSQELNAGKPTNILNVSFRGPNAEDAATVLRAIVDSYQRYLKERYQSGADDTVKLISQANELLEQKLSTKQKEYDEFLAQHPYLWKGVDGLNPIQERIFTLEAKRSALIIQEAEIVARIAAIEKALKEGQYSRAEMLAMNPISQMSQTSQPTQGIHVSQVMGAAPSKDNTPYALSMEERLMALELQEKTLLEDYGPDHPQVRLVHDQLTLLLKRIKHSGEDSKKGDSAAVVPFKTSIQALNLELENTRKAEETLNKLLFDEQRKARPLRAIEKRDELYRMEIARSQQLFDALAKRLDEVSILRDFTSGYESETVFPPNAGEKVAPKAVLVIPIGLILGILIGFGLAYVAEISDQSFRTPEEVRRRLGLPVIGHIPFLSADNEEKLLSADGPQVDPILCTAHRPKSREAESYRGVRTAIFFNRQGGHSIIQVTSPDMGDGKSTLIANLAISIAQAEKKVLLIDADFRRPRVHKLFNLNAEQGLSSVMSGDTEPSGAIQSSPIRGLSILPSGPIPHNPAELLVLPRFKELLESLRENYDFVLIDTPPLLAVTDPCAVIPYVDGVVLTIRISKNARPSALRAKEILSTLGGRVIGVVVNGVASKSQGYGYNSGYGYGYTYGYHNYSNYENNDSSSSDTGGKENTLRDGTPDISKRKQFVSRRESGKKTGFFSWLFNRK